MSKKYTFKYEYIKYKEKFGEFLSVEQIAYIAGIKPVTLNMLIEREIICLDQMDSNKCIHVKNIPKLKRLIRLHYDLGIGWNSMGVVSDLLDRIDELEKQLEIREQIVADTK